MVVSAGAFAQSSMTVSDTIVNTGTETATLKLADSWNNVAVQVIVTKLSGTVGGTVTLMGSLDGTNYVSASTDTLTPTNVTTNTFIWNVTPSKYLYYRIKYVGTGTMAATMAGYVLPRKLN